MWPVRWEREPKSVMTGNGVLCIMGKPSSCLTKSVFLVASQFYQMLHLQLHGYCLFTYNIQNLLNIFLLWNPPLLLSPQMPPSEVYVQEEALRLP